MRQNRKLREIAIIAAGQGAPQGEDNYCVDGTPFIKAGNLIELINGKAETEVQKVNEQVARNHKLKKYPQGTVLFAKSGMSCMKGYVYQLKNPCYVVSHLACIIPKAIKGEYLKYYFEFHKPNSLVKDEAYPSISLLDIGELSISYGSEAEQEEIVRNLDKINRIINKRRLEIQKIDDLVKSQFIEMFGDPIRNTQKRVTTEFINVVKMQRGFDLPVQERVQSGNVLVFGSNGALDRHNVAKVLGGGVITGRSGTIGKVFYTEEDYWPLNTSLFSVDTHGNNIIFLAYLLQLYDLTRFTEGTGVPTLNRNKFHNQQIIDVPLDEQNAFARFVKQTDKSKVLNLIHFFSINPYRRVVKSGKICYNKAHKEVV